MRWQVDIPALVQLNRYWERYPPVQVMLAAYLGIGKPAAPKQESFTEFMAAFPPVPYQPPGAV